MARITIKNVKSVLFTLNTTLNLPTEPYALSSTGQYDVQTGCIHLSPQNGANNIYQMHNSAGGVAALAYGLTTREAYDWAQAVVEGIRLARNPLYRVER